MQGLCGEECRELIILKNTNTNKDDHDVATTTIAILWGSKGDSNDSNLLLGTGCFSDYSLNLLYDSIKKVKTIYSMTSGLHKVNKHSAVKFNCQNFSNSKDITWSIDIEDILGRLK